MIIQHKQKGFSLVEVMITFLILGFGLLALAKFQGTLTTQGAIAKQQGDALTIAKDTLDQWRHFGVLDTTTGKVAYADIASQSPQTTTVNGISYTINRTVMEEQVYPNPEYKKLEVTVNWTDRIGSTHTILLTSIISKSDPGLSGSAMQDTSGGFIAPPT